MNCNHCVEDLTAYMDRELDPVRLREMEAHLAGCPACRTELESLERAIRLVESHVDEIEPDPEIWNGLMTRISAEPPGHRAGGLLQLFVGRRWTAATATLAVSLVIAAGGWGIWSHRQSEKAFQQYMDSYVQLRAHQEQDRSAALKSARTDAGTAVDHSEYSDNPFVEFDSQETDNPFRSEEQ